MREVVIADESWRGGTTSGKRDVLLSTLNKRIVFVIALLFNPFPARTSFAANIDERGGFSHDPRVTVAVIAKAGGVTHHKAFGIFQQRLKRIWILAPIFPAKDPA